MISAQTIRIALSVLTILVGLAIGLLLRLLLVRRLRKTVLDNWLVQMLGILVILPTLFVGVFASTGLLVNDFGLLWRELANLLNVRGPDLLNWGKNLVLSLLILLITIGVARTVSKLIIRGLSETRLGINTRVLLARIAFILLMLIAVFWVLALWQVGIELPVALLGALTVAITFSLQDIAKDLVAGFYILLEHPFLIGDQISTDAYTGKVVTVELRATRLRLVSGEEVTIPNSLIFGGVVINNSHYAERRATLMLTLPLEDFNRETTPAQIIANIRALDEVLAKPEPTVALSGITGENVELTVRFWINNGQLATVTDVAYTLRTLLPSADLSVKESAGDI